MNRVTVAFGSNIGDRVGHIENALDALRKHGIRVLAISRLYETKAMYYQNQASFLNGVVIVETSLGPLPFLDLLQKIENELGRVRKIEKGPRTLDLDILLFNDQQIDHERLKVPHPLMHEREFVLRPLADVFPECELSIPSSGVDARLVTKLLVSQVLERVVDRHNPMYPVTCVSPFNLLTPAILDPSVRTQVMSIMNITPDSFSDGGNLTAEGTEHVVATAKAHVEAGATIIDIGGQSTRPKATFISAEEELIRVLSPLKAIRQIPEIASGKVLVSLDTFHASVVRECISLGLVDIINDVTAGQYDPFMLSTAAELKKPIVLMHMRGMPENMSQKEFTDYESVGGVINGVAAELSQRVSAALDAGILPWRIILDPGLGFAKTQQGSLQLLKAGPKTIELHMQPYFRGFPWLVGPSRKGFIGKITGVKEAKDRSWGTAACVTASVAQSTNIVRVHDVQEMVSVVKMADAIYRTPLSVQT